MEYVYKSIKTICPYAAFCFLLYLAVVHLSGLKSLILVLFAMMLI
jgi:hypothetical protein